MMIPQLKILIERGSYFRLGNEMLRFYLLAKIRNLSIQLQQGKLAWDSSQALLA